MYTLSNVKRFIQDTPEITNSQEIISRTETIIAKTGDVIGSGNTAYIFQNPEVEALFLEDLSRPEQLKIGWNELNIRK